ncbi:MAG TPA: type II toxin-antitoxin system YhaV family toxin [Gemmatimonadaceae bacterium]|jgi:toxin YhaV
MLAHPLFLSQIERLVLAAESERSTQGPNTKLLGHLLDLAFTKIPADPAKPAFRHGGTLSGDRKNWFREKKGNGRYRLFYRFQSSAKIIVLVWVNDADSLRTYGSNADAYATFARMLDSGNPPDDWDALVHTASEKSAAKRLVAVSKRASLKRR